MTKSNAAAERAARRARRRAPKMPPVDGRPILAALDLAGWTALRLADDLDVARQSVSQWVTGDRLVPHARAVEIVRVFVNAGCQPPTWTL